MKSFIEKINEYHEAIIDDENSAELMRNEFSKKYRRLRMELLQAPFTINMMPNSLEEYQRFADFSESLNMGQQLDDYNIKLADFYSFTP